ncbi:hypothetical protein FRC01_002159 [Tulasnella sp. 417]|nr:hypothetical protein FRC01_002159 [Tulasnella sp. 417]
MRQEMRAQREYGRARGERMVPPSKMLEEVRSHPNSEAGGERGAAISITRLRELNDKIKEVEWRAERGSIKKHGAIQSDKSAHKATLEEGLLAPREEERFQKEVLVQSMKEVQDKMQREEKQLELAKLRAQQEAEDFERRRLGAEAELKKLRGRLEHPSKNEADKVAPDTQSQLQQSQRLNSLRKEAVASLFKEELERQRREEEQLRLAKLRNQQ